MTGDSVRDRRLRARILSRPGLALLCVTVGFAVAASPAAAAPGSLDTSFGTQGIVTSNPLGDSGGDDVAVQSDGKIVVVGYTTSCSEGNETSCESGALVERYDSDGSLDTSFGGGDGIVMDPSIDAVAVAIEPGGKIVVGGAHYDAAEERSELAVARFDSDGTPDISFGGGDGLATAPLNISGATSPTLWSGSMVLQSRGKVVLAGEYRVVEEVAPGFREWESHPVLVRFDADGTLDSSFGSGGIATGPRGQVYGIDEAGEGKLVTASRIGAQFGVFEFDADGSLNTSFGEGGDAVVDLSQTGSQADDVLVEPDGKIVASGWGYLPAIVRFDADGTLDRSFGGGDGITYTGFEQPCCGDGAAISLARQADGRIVFAGEWVPDEDDFADEWAIGRLYADGDPDLSFGSNGLVTTDLGHGASDDYATGVALQADGKILATGGTGYPTSKLALARYLGGGGSPQPAVKHVVVTKGGAGEGIVVGPELNCGVNCGADYEEGATVELDAFGEYGSGFEGWSTIAGDPGTCTGTTGRCEVTVDEDIELEARFRDEPVTEPTLTVAHGGNGSGTVSSLPTGIDCGSTCSHAYVTGTTVELSASQPLGSTFSGWSGGGCTGTGICRLILDADTTVTATFAIETSRGGDETPAGGGGSAGGETVVSPSSPSPTQGAPVTTSSGTGSGQTSSHPKPIQCRKGFKKGKVHGKAKCVKAKKRHVVGNK